MASSHSGLINLFVRHRVASNLLMFLFILAGLWGLKKLNAQTFPQFELDLISINVAWSGASAEDIERSVTIPIEQSLSTLTEIKKLTSASRQGMASFTLELFEGSPVNAIVNKVKQKVESIRNLPDDAEHPIIQQIERLSPVANILITGPNNLEEITQLAHRFENQLLERGIRQIKLVGLPSEEIAIEVPSTTIHELGLSLNQMADRVQQNSRDLPAGTATKNEVSKQVRSLNQQRSVPGFEQLPLTTDSQGRLIRVSDVATVVRRPQEDQDYITWQGKPAIEMILMRTEADDTLKTADIFNQWVEDIQTSLPQGVELHVYNERWKHLKERIELLLTNGAGGLILVVCTLLLFLRVRVALWVVVGIPTSFLAALAILYGIGGSINMISLFALIMALGIIVDDAIVVGEDTLSHVENGEPPLSSAIGGAHRMLPPVIASSLTTIAAFLPLVMIQGVMGKIIFDMPTVVICVIIASLVECFLILPGHLHHSLKKQKPENPKSIRARFEKRFNIFRETKLRPTVILAIRYKGTTVTLGIAMFIFAIAIMKTGYLKFSFFPTVESNQIRASVEFNPGTSEHTVNHFLQQMEDALVKTEQELGGDLILMALTYHRRSYFGQEGGPKELGTEKGAIIIDMRPGKRKYSNVEIIKTWRKHIKQVAGISKFVINQRTMGPPGQAIAFQLIGDDSKKLKAASLELQDAINQYTGVLNVDDNLPFGQEQLIYALTPTGRSLGLTTQSVGQQLRAAFDGAMSQIFYDQDDEIEVRVMLPETEREQSYTLEQFPIVTPNQHIAPLGNVVQFHSRQGISQLNHTNGKLTVVVGADIDATEANANQITDELNKTIIPSLKKRYGISTDAEGLTANQKETLGDMLTGVTLGLMLIYIILAWVFSSYSWPFAVMAAIPLGLTGAILGHFLLGKDLSLLSLMGLFGLSGIVINDSIVLISFYAKLRRQGQNAQDAIINAICVRFRAVLLTSLTTIAGLLPILFETSMQAQFLIPMAISIVFGLGYGTLLILFFIPALLIFIETTKQRIAVFLAPTQ